MKFSIVQKGLCVLFSALVVFCAAMTGTYAWRDYAQHKSNEFIGISTADEPITVRPTTTTTTSTTGPTTTDTTTTRPTTTTTRPTTTTKPTTTTTKPTTTTAAPTTTQPTTSATQPSTITATQPPVTTTRPTVRPSNPGPVTGDTSNIWLWAVLTVLSALGLRWVLLWGKRGRREGDSA